MPQGLHYKQNPLPLPTQSKKNSPPPPAPVGSPRGPIPSVREIREKGIAIVGNFETWPWGQHPDEAYLADAIEGQGVKVHRVYQRSGIPPVPAAWAVFTSHPESFGDMARWLPTCPVMLWTLDLLPGYPERTPTLHVAAKADMFVSSDRYDWRGAGTVIDHAFLAGACEGVTPAFEPRPVRSCAFLGTLYNDRRHAIAEIVRQHGGDVVDDPRSWLYGHALAKFVQETAVIVGDNARNDIPFYWSTRNYVIPGAGGFLLTPHVPGLETHLENGTHAAFYGKLDELSGQLEKWIAESEARERIRRTGFDHVRTRHNWTARAVELLGILEARHRMTG